MNSDAHTYTWNRGRAPLPPVDGEAFEGHEGGDVLPALELVDNGVPTGRVLFTDLFPYDDSEAAFVKADTKAAEWVCFGSDRPKTIEVDGVSFFAGTDEYEDAHHEACVEQAKAALIQDYAAGTAPQS
jgi:hypothetical protein